MTIKDIKNWFKKNGWRFSGAIDKEDLAEPENIGEAWSFQPPLNLADTLETVIIYTEKGSNHLFISDIIFGVQPTKSVGWLDRWYKAYMKKAGLTTAANWKSMMDQPKKVRWCPMETQPGALTFPQWFDPATKRKIIQKKPLTVEEIQKLFESGPKRIKDHFNAPSKRLTKQHGLGGAVYPGNLGFEELIKFFNEANLKEQQEMLKILDNGDWKAYKKLIAKVLKIKLANFMESIATVTEALEVKGRLDFAIEILATILHQQPLAFDNLGFKMWLESQGLNVEHPQPQIDDRTAHIAFDFFFHKSIKPGLEQTIKDSSKSFGAQKAKWLNDLHFVVINIQQYAKER